MKLATLWKIFPALLFAGFLAACGGGSGGGGSSNDDTGGTDPADCTSDGGTVVLSGSVLFEDVPPVTTFDGVKLDYDNIEQKPVREAKLAVECADGSEVYAESATDAAGAFSVNVPDGVDVRVVVRAESERTGGPIWDVKVVDNTNAQAVWALESDTIAIGSGNVDVELVAESGWDGFEYSGERIAGAFSILDTVYDSMSLVLTADGNATFAPLLLNWSPNNRVTCSSGTYPYTGGCIGTSFFTAREVGGEIIRQIFIVGEENRDTDEYDDTIVAHEWGHYYENSFARSDSVGGPHRGGDALDIRVAFGEGWGNAVSGMITGDTKYRDTSGSQQDGGFDIGLENESTVDPGWWNETSVQLILYDLYDANDDHTDTITLGFGPLHEVLTGPQRSTEAFTSIFSMVHYLVDTGAVSAADMSALLSFHDIADINDIWGSNRVNKAPNSNQELYTDPAYLDLSSAVNNGTPTDICVTKFYGEYNKLGSRRFGYFTANAAGNYRFELDGTGGVEGSDPDLYLYDNGNPATAGEDLFEGTGGDWSSPDAPTDPADPNHNPDWAEYGDSVEVAEAELQTGTVYVMDLHEWMNHDALFTDDGGSTGGEVCLELRVSMP